MGKLEQIDKVLEDIRELRQRMMIHDIQLVGLDIRFPETDETTHVTFTREGYQSEADVNGQHVSFPN